MRFHLRRLALVVIGALALGMIAAFGYMRGKIELQNNTRGSPNARALETGASLNANEESDTAAQRLENMVNNLAAGFKGNAQQGKAHVDAPASRGGDPDDDIHIIFSTGCNAYQQWQAELLLYTHFKSGQRGKITRIVSGCEDTKELKHHKFVTHPGGGLDKIVSLSYLEKSTHPDFMLHTTPAFEGSKEFPWFNKPFSIEHWAKKGEHHPSRGAVVIIDPDEIFLEPITQHPLDPSDLLFSGIPAEPGLNVVKPKKPVAQMYGLGDGWVHKFDRDSICGKDSPCSKVDSKTAWVHYSVGPPYIIHMQDMKGLTTLWSEYMRPVFKVIPGDILTDMWAYIMGAANLGMPHTKLEQYMVSAVDAYGEGWKFVDDWGQMSCHNPKKPAGKRSPNFLHFAHNYHTDDSDGRRWMWHKGHMPSNILECDMPILKQPPDNFYNSQRDNKAKRNAWMMCHLYSNMNAMLTAYKAKFCEGKTVNLDRRIRLIQQKTLPCPKDKRYCWPLAQLEDESLQSSKCSSPECSPH